MKIRRLTPEDLPIIQAFLQEHRESSMFLLHNLAAAGLASPPGMYRCVWWGAFAGRSLQGVFAQTWRGTLLLQLPSAEAISALAEFLHVQGDRPRGVLGPREQWLELQACWNLELPPPRLDQDEPIYRLELTRLRRVCLEERGLVVRPAVVSDGLLLAQWRMAFLMESLLLPASRGLLRRAHREVMRACVEARAWVLEDQGVSVAWCSFNAVFPGAVQVSGLYTPERLRGKGYGQAVASSVLAQAADGLGAGLATVIIQETHRPALSCCEALRFERCGRYSFIQW